MFVFFRTRNSAETAHLTFLIPMEERGLIECIRICGKLHKTVTNNDNIFAEHVKCPKLIHHLF